MNVLSLCVRYRASVGPCYRSWVAAAWLEGESGGLRGRGRLSMSWDARTGPVSRAAQFMERRGRKGRYAIRLLWAVDYYY